MSFRKAVWLGQPERRKRQVSFLTPDEAYEVAKNRLRVPESMAEVRDLCHIEMARWKDMTRSLRDAGVHTADGQYYLTTMKGPAVMAADQTTLTGTTKGLLTPLGGWNSFITNEVKRGSSWRLFVGGIATTPASAATTIIVDPIYGTTSGGTSLGVGQTSGTVAASQTNACWNARFNFICRTDGAAGTAVGKGDFNCPRILTAAPIGGMNLGLESATATTIDTTAAAGLLIAATLGGSASFTAATQILALENLA